MASGQADGEDFYRTLLDAFPAPILVVDEDVEVVDRNAAAAALVGGEVQLRRRAGDVLHCLHAQESPEGCGRSRLCRDCLVRKSVGEAHAGGRVQRRRARLELVRQGAATEVHVLLTAVPLAYRGRRLVMVLLEDVTELNNLRAVLPICAGCRRIRDDQAYWQSVERYFKEHLDVDFSHGLCPDCLERLYPEIADD